MTADVYTRLQEHLDRLPAGFPPTESAVELRILKRLFNICCCCGDCCLVLKNLKRHPAPAAALVSPFTARLDADPCVGCETCTGRCQMEALSMQDGRAVLAAERCIGCGLCVSTCPSGALTLTRKPPELQPVVPGNQREAFARRAKARAEIALTSKLERHARR